MAKRESILARPLEEQRRAAVDCLRGPLQVVAEAPETRRRWLNLRALERDQWLQYHYWLRSVGDEQLRVLFGEIGRSESQHSLALDSLLPVGMGSLERALAGEQGALETMVLLAQEEVDANARAGFEYLTLDILEHAYLIAEQVRANGGDPVAITRDGIPLERGRPLGEQHMASFDAIKRSYDKGTVGSSTRARLVLAVAIARALFEDYGTLVEQVGDIGVRRVLAGIRAMKEEHATFCASFLDARETPLERAVVREHAEVIWYRRLLEEEQDPAMQAIFRDHLADEIAHLTIWEDQRRREGQDSWSLTHDRLEGSAQAKPLPEFVARLRKSHLQTRSKGKSYVEIGKTIEAFS